MLTAKARLLAASRKQTLDRPPCICPGGMMNMIFEEVMESCGFFWPEAHSDAVKMAGLAKALYALGGFENYGLPFCMTVEAEAMGASVNMGEKLVEPHMEQPLFKDLSQLDKLKTLSVESGRTKTVLKAIHLLKAENANIPIIGNLTGPLSTAGSLVDMTVLLKSFRKDEKKAAALLDFVADNLIIFGKAQLAAGADAICIAEPSGTGEILGPVYFEKFTIPYLNKISQALKAPITIIHICGNLRSVYELLPQLNCDIFSFDAMVPIAEIKKHISEKAVMGNISTHALSVMPPAKIATLTENCLKNRVDILAPACGLSTKTPLLNIQTMLKTLKRTAAQ
ncbi:MAG: MtaA/CmuA family methyltransferase [Clostridia bacterium]|nr:MtaA/CmuA family methyltransferase [Clostridia bacterium]